MTAVERRLRRRKWLTYGLGAASTVLLVHAFLGESGYLATVRARRDYNALMDAVVKVRLENQALRERARQLKDDPATLEDAARRELNLTRPGEVLVIIRDPAPARRPE
jgi:cell division protein FtsB